MHCQYQKLFLMNCKQCHKVGFVCFTLFMYWGKLSVWPNVNVTQRPFCDWQCDRENVFGARNCRLMSHSGPVVLWQCEPLSSQEQAFVVALWQWECSWSKKLQANVTQRPYSVVVRNRLLVVALWHINQEQAIGSGAVTVRMFLEQETAGWCHATGPIV